MWVSGATAAWLRQAAVNMQDRRAMGGWRAQKQTGMAATQASSSCIGPSRGARRNQRLDST